MYVYDLTFLRTIFSLLNSEMDSQYFLKKIQIKDIFLAGAEIIVLEEAAVDELDCCCVDKDTLLLAPLVEVLLVRRTSILETSLENGFEFLEFLILYQFINIL